MTDKEMAVVKSVQDMIDSEHKLTGIKVELEGQLNRRNRLIDCPEGCLSPRDCGVCYEGRIDDPECSCGDCEIDCEECRGQGYIECEHAQDLRFGSESFCQQFMLEKLAPFGLAKKVGSEWVVDGPLVFAKFYRDGSVDSEFTFTLKMDNPENVLLLPKFIDVWNELVEANGEGCDVRGAGMHMSVLNTKNAYYEKDEWHGGASTGRSGDTTRFSNFRKSMTLLLPSLFFLGASSGTTRPLRFRKPQVASDHKHSAISWFCGALEFRVFDTCYDKPEHILDNVVVISKAVTTFWTEKYTRNFLPSMKNVKFGIDSNDSLERFYVTKKHMDLLNKGLRILKPDYLTIREVKKQRDFKVTLKDVNSREERIRKELLMEYKEYEDRFGWSVVLKRDRYLADLAVTKSYADPVKAIAEMSKEADKWADEEKKKIKSQDQYIDENLGTRLGGGEGQFILA